MHSNKTYREQLYCCTEQARAAAGHPQRHGRRAMQQHAQPQGTDGTLRGHMALVRGAGTAHRSRGRRLAWLMGGDGRWHGAAERWHEHGAREAMATRRTSTARHVRLDAFGAKQRGCTSGQSAGSAGVVRQNGRRIVRTAGGARLGMTKDETWNHSTRRTPLDAAPK